MRLDNNIAKSIFVLNKKGYYTKYCCEGHTDCAYVYFKNNCIVPYLRYLPITWEIDMDDFKKGNVIIRSDSIDIEEQKQSLFDLYCFAMSLPYNKNI